MHFVDEGQGPVILLHVLPVALLAPLWLDARDAAHCEPFVESADDGAAVSFRLSGLPGHACAVTVTVAVPAGPFPGG